MLSIYLNFFKNLANFLPTVVRFFRNMAALAAATLTAPEVASTATSIFLEAIRNLTPPQQWAAVTEIETFFSGAYPCLDGDVLKWWKVSVIMYVLLLPPTTA